MYSKFVLKRVMYGVVMYIVMITTFSILFNSVAEQTLYSQIEEQITQQIRKYNNMNKEQLAQIASDMRLRKIKQYHLDEPIVSRIFFRTVDTLMFNYGISTTIKAGNGDREVLKIELAYLPNTLILFTTQVLLTIVIGIPMGLWAARKPNGFLDRMTSSISMITAGLPAWWMGLIMIMAFAYGPLGIFPSGGIHVNPAPEGWDGVLDYLWHLSLPLLTLVLLSIWSTAYVVRNIVLGNLQEDYVMAARARGIPERFVLLGHTLRTSMPAILTIVVLSLFGSISGNIVFEGIFGWPGLGKLYWVAIGVNDIPVLMGTLAISTLINIVGFILLDIIYGWLDPRIKVGGKA
jgi:peptide/nickel transport system permease protein